MKSLIKQQTKHGKSCISKKEDIVLVDQADVEIIKIRYMSMMLDISIGQHGGLCTLDFMNHLDCNVIGQDHLLKRSILVLKAWLSYESSLLGSQLACMATYGMYTLALFVFNNFSKVSPITTEMEFVRKFFEVLGTFDWDKYMITIFGPVRIQNFYDRLRDECNFDMNLLALNERIHYFGFKTQQSSLEAMMFTPEHIQPLIDKYAALRLLSYSQGPDAEAADLSLKFKKSMNLKFINIVDPCFSKNNLGKSISLFNSYRLKEALKMQSESLAKVTAKAHRYI